MALTELARFLPRPEQRNRFLRGGMRSRDMVAPKKNLVTLANILACSQGLVELPPGGSFDPHPQGSEPSRKSQATTPSAES